MCFVPARMGLLISRCRTKIGGSIQEGQTGVLMNLRVSVDGPPPVRRQPSQQIQHLNISAGICLCKTRSVCRRPVSSPLLTIVLLGQKLRPTKQKPLTV